MRLQGQLPPTADDWLWGADSPFNALGRLKGTEKESAIVVNESLKRHPLASFGLGLLPALQQFVMIRTGDGIAPQQWVLDPEFRHFLPGQLAAYHAARQQNDLVRFEAVNVVHVAIVSLIARLAWLCAHSGAAPEGVERRRPACLRIPGPDRQCTGVRHVFRPARPLSVAHRLASVAVLLLTVRGPQGFVLPRRVESGT